MAIPPLGQGLHGISSTTPANLWLDAGVLYFDIDVDALRASGTGQLTNAIADATLLGATRGGSEFSLGKQMRMIDVDGKRFPIKGLVRVSGYEPSLTVNLLEISVELMRRGWAPMDVQSHTAYDEISSSVEIDPTHYFDNIALITTISGKADPVVLVLENCLAIENNDIKVEDNNEMVYEVKFVAFADASTPHDSPVRIFYPKTANFS